MLTCMWEHGIYLGVKATTAEIIVGIRNGVWLTRTVRRKLAKGEMGSKKLGNGRGLPVAQK